MVEVLRKMMFVIILNIDDYVSSVAEDNDHDNENGKSVDVTRILSGYKDVLWFFFDVLMPDHITRYMMPVSANCAQS